MGSKPDETARGDVRSAPAVSAATHRRCKEPFRTAHDRAMKIPAAPPSFREILVWLVFVVAVSGTATAQRPQGARLDDWRTNWDKKNIDVSELSVNIPRDAIPAIDHPKFVSIEEARAWIGEKEPVVSLVIDGVARAYPLQILTWHEIVNDDVSFGIPVTVTFCPLCYSAIAFDRRVDGRTLEFGVSGMLRHSDLVMYDRQTHTLWQQLSGEGIVGDLTGVKLTQIPAQIISFEQFRTAHPDGMVLSRDTGHRRNYGQNPYVGYDDVNQRPFLYKGPTDDRLRPMEKVVAVSFGGVDKAYPYAVTRRAHVIHDEVGGQPIVVFHSEKGATSALDKSRIAESRVVGSTGVFDPRIDGRMLHFSYEDGRFVDAETGSVWDVTGRALSGPMAGRQLRALPHGDYFSFAWFAFKPNTDVYRN